MKKITLILAYSMNCILDPSVKSASSMVGIIWKTCSAYLMEMDSLGVKNITLFLHVCLLGI
jgi:hypothetical protein